MIATMSAPGRGRVAAQIAQVPASLGIVAQPAGAVTAIAFTTQPAVEIRDNSGNRCTGSSLSVTVAKASGSGTLTGTTTVAASSGLASFTDLVITGTGAHTLTFTATALASATSDSFTVAASGSGVAMVYASAWTNGTGTADSAVLDNSKWNQRIEGGPGVAATPDRLSVIAATGLDFPATMANVLKVRYPSAYVADSYWNVELENGWALPANGGFLYTRLYWRHDISGTDATTCHTVSTGPPGSCPYTWGHQYQRSGSSNLVFWISTTVSPNQHTWQLPTLARNTTYRTECKWERISTNSWRLSLRTYNSANTLVYSNSDYLCTWHGTHNLQTWNDASGTVTSVTDCLRNLMIGQQNIANTGSADTSHDAIYYGGVAVSVVDWCGAYTLGEGP